MPITLRQIEAFRALMMAGSVTRAAHGLGVSQPAVSRTLAELERTLGYRLFERAGRRIVATAEARALIVEVERAFLGLDHVAQVAEALRAHGGGPLRLITIPSLVPIVTVTLVAGFLHENPGMTIALEVQSTQRVFDWLVSQQCDIGIATTAGPNTGLETHRIGRSEAACILPARHPLARGAGPLHARELDGLPFVSFAADAVFRRDVDRVFDRLGIARVMRAEARTTDAVCSLVAAGIGVGVIPTPGPQIVHDPRLVLRPFRPRLRSDLVLVRNPQRRPTRVAQAFIDHARRNRAQLAAVAGARGAAAPPTHAGARR